MLFCVCRFYGLSFSQLNTFKIKTICWKQSTKKWKYIHYKSVPLLFLFFRPMWLHGLLTPRCITLLPSSALLQPPNALDPLSRTHGTRWGEPVDGGSGGDSYLARLVWVERADHTGSVSSPQTPSKRAGFTSVSEVPQCLPVQKKRRHRRETRMNPGRKTVPLHGEVEIKQSDGWGRNCVLGFTDNL